MAREQRRDVDYFPHPCRHGRKMHIIEQKYGNDGYAVWFKLLEQLGAANNHYIDVSEEMNFMYLISIFKVDENTAKSILNDLAKLGAIDKFLYEKHQVIFSDKFAESVKDAYRKRTSKAPQYSDILNILGIKIDQSGGRNPQSGGSKAEVGPKEKKSKGKERKEEENARDESTLFSIDILKSEYLKNKRICNAIIKSQKLKSHHQLSELLTQFNSHLDQTGAFSKTWLDYTNHFRNWLGKKTAYEVSKKSSTRTREYF